VLEQRFRHLFDKQWEIAALAAEVPMLPKKGASEEVPRPVVREESVTASVVDWATQSETQIEDYKSEEDKYFRLFRQQVRECLHGLIRHPRFKTFLKPVDQELYDDYHEFVKEPICLEDMQRNNNEEKYEDIDTVRKDFEKIANNALAYNTDKDVEVKVRTYASEFKDVSLMKLDCLDEVVVREWGILRARRNAREKWLEAKEGKDATKAKKDATPAKPKESQPAKPKEMTRSKVRALSGTCGDVLPECTQKKLKRLGCHLTPVLQIRTESEKKEILVDAALSMIAEIEEATNGDLPMLERCLETLFETKTENEPMSSYASGIVGHQLEEACDEFCHAVQAKLLPKPDSKAKPKGK
jgi:hypothetical protein